MKRLASFFCFFTSTDQTTCVSYTVNNYSPLQALYRQMLFFPYALEYKIYCLKLYHLLNFTLHSKANAQTYRHLFQILYKNALYIGTCFRFYTQMRVEKNPKHLHIEFIVNSHNSASCSELYFAKHLVKPGIHLLVTSQKLKGIVFLFLSTNQNVSK